MSRFKSATGLIATLALVLATAPVALARTSSGSATRGLSIEKDTTSELSGRFYDSSSKVTFKARQVTPTNAEVTLIVNGTTITAERDLSTGSARWGASGKAMGPDDHAVVLKLHNSLATQWVKPAKKGAGLGGKQDLTLRLVMLAAEAPVGLPLPNQTVSRPGERRLEKQGTATAVTAATNGTKKESCEADVVTITAAGSTERRNALSACQQSNEDGILYFGNCSTTGRYLCHDSNSHCFLCEVKTAGPGSSKCLGECGPGCNGLNIYTYDCGDHDQCTRAHGGSTNPWDAECGDEYFEADDDFIWGWPNC